MKQRVALLSAELSVLGEISAALAAHGNVEQALALALATAFEIGGISMGALYLSGDGAARCLRVGEKGSGSDDDLADFFGDRALLDRAIAAGALLAIPSPEVAGARGEAVLDRAHARSLLLVPLVFRGQAHGALLLLSTTADLASEDRKIFAGALGGQVSQGLALARAFAEKDAAEQEARAQGAILRSILDGISDGVVVADRQGQFLHWNPAARAIAGVDPPEGPPETWPAHFGIFRSDKVTRVPTEELTLVRALRGESVDRQEYFVRNDRAPDGIWVTASARPFGEEAGVGGGVVVLRDVTAEKAAQAQLMASDRMSSIGMLAAGVAHEINNPLSVVLANVELAQIELGERTAAGDVQGGEALGAMLDDARKATCQVRQIVRELKLFSRHEETPPGPVDIHGVLDSTVRMARNELRHRARLVREYGSVGFVHGSESRLGQVFLNLVVNAAQAIPEGRAGDHRVRVATRPLADGRVAVEISDTGEGIAPEAMEHLFTPFFTTKPVGVGTGLGLSICHRIVTGLGGEIQVDSEVGKGTTFRVLLPPAHASAQPTASVAPGATRASRRARVLVVDDEPMMGAVIRRALPEHEVVVEERPGAAIERLRAGEPFDVILCDVMMADMTARDFHAALLRLNPGRARAVVFMTGGAFTAGARAFLDEISNPKLEKPFEPRALSALVNGLVG